MRSSGWLRTAFCIARGGPGAAGRDGGTLGGVAVLMSVGGDGRDAGEAEVEDGDVVAKLLAPGEDEAAEAGVDMETDALLQRDLREPVDGVDGPVAVVAG